MVEKEKNVGRINPLQVNKLPNNIEDDDEEYSSTKSALALHLDFLTTFFYTIFSRNNKFSNEFTYGNIRRVI